MNAIILMTRVPYRGHTKTRMMPYLSPQDCEVLHKAFLRDYFEVLNQLTEISEIFIAYAPEKCSDDFLKTLPKAYKYFEQEGVNIGSRMFKAFETLFDKGYKKVLLVGCDIPQIRVVSYKMAFDMLESKDLVINPTEDGGYCLIAMKENHKSLFINYHAWGEASVIDTTLQTADLLELNVHLGEPYRDIDEFEDLMAFRELYKSSDLEDELIPIHTLDFVERLLEEEVVYG